MYTHIEPFQVSQRQNCVNKKSRLHLRTFYYVITNKLTQKTSVWCQNVEVCQQNSVISGKSISTHYIYSKKSCQIFDLTYVAENLFQGYVVFQISSLLYKTK